MRSRPRRARPGARRLPAAAPACLAASLLAGLLAGVTTAARAQEPPAPAEAVALDAIAEGDAPGGVDFRDAAKVQDELARVREAYAKLDPQAQAGVARQLERQQEVLGRQRDFLARRDRIERNAAEATDARLAEVQAARDAAKAALVAFDANALIEHLEESAGAEALAARIEQEYAAPAAAARKAADAADAELAAIDGEVATLPRRLEEARAVLAATRGEIEQLRARRDAPDLAPEQRAELFEQSLAAEEEHVHQRLRAAWLEQAAAPYARLRAVAAVRQQELRAAAGLAEAQLAAARRHEQEQVAQARAAAQAEIEQRERELAESTDEGDRAFREAALEVSRLEARQRAVAEEIHALAERLDGAQAQLAEARAQHDGYVERYRGDGAAARAVSTSGQVVREIDALQEQTRYFERQALRSELRDLLRDAEAEHAAAQAAAREAAAGFARRRDAARALDPGSAWEAQAARWDGLQAQLAGASEAWLAAEARRIEMIEQLLDAETQTWEMRNDALAVLRSENLFLLEESDFSADAVVEAVEDLIALPGFVVECGADVARWTASASRVRPLLACVAALLPLALATLLLRRWLAARSARLRALDLASLPVRTALLLAHAGRIACTALAIWVASLIPVALFEDLPEIAIELLRGGGRLLALFWLGRGLARELLRPEPPERMVLGVDRRTARRVGFGVVALLWIWLLSSGLELLLLRFAYRNAGALAALDLATKIVGGALLVFVLLQRQFLVSLLPETKRALGRLLRRVAAFVHPFLVLLVPTLVVLDAVGYRILAAFVARVSVLLLAAFPIGSILYQALVFAVEAWRDRRLARIDAADPAAEAQQARVRGLDEIARFLLRVTVIVLVAAALLQFTGTSLASLKKFFDRPLPLQDAADPAQRRTWWNLVVALLIAVATLRLSRFLKIALRDVALPQTQLAAGTRYTITLMVVYVLNGLGLWLAVTQVLDVQNIGYLVAALSVGIGFGLQEIVGNFVAGLIMLVERPVKQGDIIGMDGAPLGLVRELGIRATTIQNADNHHILIPNREFITQRVINYDAIDSKVRISIDIGVTYGSDLKRVREVLLEVAGKDGRVMRKPPPEVFFLKFGDSALEMRLVAWVETFRVWWHTSSDLRFAIDAAFRRAGITIPFPHREVFLNTGKPLRVAVEPPEAPGAGGAEQAPEGRA